MTTSAVEAGMKERDRHSISLHSTEHLFQISARAECLCGWRGVWRCEERDAISDGANHILAKNANPEDTLDRIREIALDTTHTEKSRVDLILEEIWAHRERLRHPFSPSDGPAKAEGYQPPAYFSAEAEATAEKPDNDEWRGSFEEHVQAMLDCLPWRLRELVTAHPASLDGFRAGLASSTPRERHLLELLARHNEARSKADSRFAVLWDAVTKWHHAKRPLFLGKRDSDLASAYYDLLMTQITDTLGAETPAQPCTVPVGQLATVESPVAVLKRLQRKWEADLEATRAVWRPGCDTIEAVANEKARWLAELEQAIRGTAAPAA